jgi:RHS repeat-associated protein
LDASQCTTPIGIVTDANGAVINETKYKAWGETRYSSGTEQTKYQYTGQYSYVSDFGLHFYNARWYDSSLSRFAQADTIVPSGVQGLDRYAYANNSPLMYIDPSGHVNCYVDSSGLDYCVPNGGSAPSNATPLPSPEQVDVTTLTQSGKKGYETYVTLFNFSGGWWWKDPNLGGDGFFSIEDFLALILYLELDNWSRDDYLSNAWSEAVVRSFYSWKQAMDGLKNQGEIPSNIATDPSSNAALLNFVMRYTGKDTRTKPSDFVYKLYSPTSMAIPKVLGTINAMRSPTNGWGNGCVNSTPCRVGSNSSGSGPKLSYAQAYVNAGCPHYGAAFLGSCGNPYEHNFAFIMTADQASMFNP